MRPPTALPLLLLSLAAGPAAGDTFVLKNGAEVDGYPAGKTSRGEVVIGMASGTRKVAAASIAEVRPSADPAADFERYLGGLGKKDADGAAALGTWAKERGIPAAAETAFQRALALRPDHPEARSGLGFERVDGEWYRGEELERRRADAALREETAESYGKSMGSRPGVVLSDHWRYVDFLAGVRLPERVKDLEDAYAAAVEVFGSDPWRGRALAVACRGQEQYLRWVEKEGGILRGLRGGLLEGVKAATGLKWLEPPALVRSDLPDPGAMHAAHVHTAGHLLVGLWKVVNRELPFWVEEGFGGWMEDRILKTNTSYCYHASAEGGYGSTFRGSKQWEVDAPDWKILVKKAAAASEFLPLDQLDSLPRGDYSRREVGQSFSFVSYLLKEKEPARFRDYVERVKGGARSPVAFRQAYGVSFEQMDPDWKRFAATGGW